MTTDKRTTDTVECAICAAHGLDAMTPADTAVRIHYSPARDGANVRVVYACPECVAQDNGSACPVCGLAMADHDDDPLSRCCGEQVP